MHLSKCIFLNIFITLVYILIHPALRVYRRITVQEQDDI